MQSMQDRIMARLESIIIQDGNLEPVITKSYCNAGTIYAQLPGTLETVFKIVFMFNAGDAWLDCFFIPSETRVIGKDQRDVSFSLRDGSYTNSIGLNKFFDEIKELALLWKGIQELEADKLGSVAGPGSGANCPLFAWPPNDDTEIGLYYCTPDNTDSKIEPFEIQVGIGIDCDFHLFRTAKEAIADFRRIVTERVKFDSAEQAKLDELKARIQTAIEALQNEGMGRIYGTDGGGPREDEDTTNPYAPLIVFGEDDGGADWKPGQEIHLNFKYPDSDRLFTVIYGERGDCLETNDLDTAVAQYRAWVKAKDGR